MPGLQHFLLIWTTLLPFYGPRNTSKPALPTQGCLPDATPGPQPVDSHRSKRPPSPDVAGVPESERDKTCGAIAQGLRSLGAQLPGHVLTKVATNYNGLTPMERFLEETYGVNNNGSKPRDSTRGLEYGSSSPSTGVVCGAEGIRAMQLAEFVRPGRTRATSDWPFQATTRKYNAFPLERASDVEKNCCNNEYYLKLRTGFVTSSCCLPGHLLYTSILLTYTQLPPLSSFPPFNGPFFRSHTRRYTLGRNAIRANSKILFCRLEFTSCNRILYKAEILVKLTTLHGPGCVRSQK